MKAVINRPSCRVMPMPTRSASSRCSRRTSGARAPTNARTNSMKVDDQHDRHGVGARPRSRGAGCPSSVAPRGRRRAARGRRELPREPEMDFADGRPPVAAGSPTCRQAPPREDVDLRGGGGSRGQYRSRSAARCRLAGTIRLHVVLGEVGAEQAATKAAVDLGGTGDVDRRLCVSRRWPLGSRASRAGASRVRR